jgi:glycerol-3-phosphate O-acyltransferase
MIPGREIAAEAKRRVLARVRQEATAAAPLTQTLGGTVYHERQRLSRESPDSERARHDRAFVDELHAALAQGNEPADRLLAKVVERYADEIEGRFSESVYRFSTTVLPVGITALLNGTTPAMALPRLPELAALSDRLVISGETERLCKLSKLGAVVLAPTHVSNLDSLLLGYAIHKLGLPPFIYGAGLNLFESRVLGFFMHHLGAYSVDRAKSDPLYKAMLKEYATIALERGQHGLFFPGGTRSRSFALERRLKRGLLGTTLTAYRNRLVPQRAAAGVFIFPVTLSYPLVLEGHSLIEEFLSRAGRDRYLQPARDDQDRVTRWFVFLRHLLALDLDVHLRIGAPLDPFGCAVDADGRSLDPRGRVVDAAGYLKSGGQIVTDVARDHAYTELLEQQIVRAYRRDNVVLGTWLVAYVALEILRRKLATDDVFDLLRQVVPGTTIDSEELLMGLRAARQELTALAAKGSLAVVENLPTDANELLERALRSFESYHDLPVLERRRAQLVVGDPGLLYFYRNRLDGYGLMGAPPLVPMEAS